MSTYHYAIVERRPATPTTSERRNVDMENLDYKRQPDAAFVDGQIEQHRGVVCGIWRGGMFGLSTNQLAVLSEWRDEAAASGCFDRIAAASEILVTDQYVLDATVRPAAAERIERSGFYVLRWIDMLASDIEPYTRLCLETWPAFEAAAAARCWGVFRVRTGDEISRILMITWYASMSDWEKSRVLDPADESKWILRSEMERSHWAHGARLA